MTTWRRTRAIGTAWMALAYAGSAAAVSMPSVPAASKVTSHVEAALIASVKARMGADVDVAVGSLRVRWLDAAPRLGDSVQSAGELPSVDIENAAIAIDATPDVGARTGGSIRFLLTRRGARHRDVRLGTADAVIHVSAPHLVVTAPIARGNRIDAAAVDERRGPIDRQPLRPLIARADLPRVQSRRPLRPGDVLTDAAVMMTPLVRNGDAVRTVVRVGALEASGRAVAAETGTLGDLVTVVPVESTRRLRGRVTGPGEVEVIP